MPSESKQEADLQNFKLMLGEFDLKELKTTKNAVWFNTT